MLTRNVLCRALYLVIFILVQHTDFISSECVHGDLYQHSSDCNLFYQCDNGQLIERSCPEGLYFNPIVDVCDFPSNVTCDLTTTPITTRPTRTTAPTRTTSAPTRTTAASTSTTATPTPQTTTIIPTTIISTTTTIIPTTTPAPPSQCWFQPGEQILMGNRCDVERGFFKFQFDGNAVIYDSNNVALWNTATFGAGNIFVFQTDGNLVMYSSSGSALWNSGTHNQGATLLAFQADRNLVIYNSATVALWNTGTHIG